jgi:hypothetical protein
MGVFFSLFNRWHVFCNDLGSHETKNKEQAMPENIRYFGLCMSCRNASSCTFTRDPAKPAFYCEEFEIETTVSIIPSEKEQPLEKKPVSTDKDSTRFVGLCSDCENRQTCTFPKSEGGVWHCEEYR